MKLGEYGEQAACEYLRSKGYVIVTRNYHSRYGEIDIITRQGETLVFVEVKTRGPRAIAEGRESVGLSKQKKLRNTALTYLAQQEGDPPARFDVLELRGGIVGGPVSIEHIENAF